MLKVEIIWVNGWKRQVGLCCRHEKKCTLRGSQATVNRMFWKKIIVLKWGIGDWDSVGGGGKKKKIRNVKSRRVGGDCQDRGKKSMGLKMLWLDDRVVVF